MQNLAVVNNTLDGIARAPRKIADKIVSLRSGSSKIPAHPVIYKYHSQKGQKLFSVDITLVTFSTADRLSTLMMTLKTWSGPVHLAMYVRKEADIATLDKLLQQEKLFLDRVTVHLVWAVV